MSFLKYSSPLIFTGKELLEKSVLLVHQSGQIEGIISLNEAGEDIQRLDGILSPGFINAHCHLELSHLKGQIPEKMGLVDFVHKVVTQRHFPEEEILQCIADGESEMYNNGIVAVGDICNNTYTITQKAKQKLRYHNFIEVSGWNPSIAQNRFDKSKQYLDDFIARLLECNASLSPHAPYSVSNELWQLLMPNFANNIITIHNQETAFEDDLFLNKSGDFLRMYELMGIDNSFFKPTKMSSLQSYFDKMKDAKNLLFVHNTFTNEADMLVVKNSGANAFWCICINANLYIEAALPPIDLLLKHQQTIVLGTDSLASNHSLNILDEIKTIRKNFPHIDLKEILQWATLNGAVALNVDDNLGSFEKNKTPGVLLLDHQLNTVKRLH